MRWLILVCVFFVAACGQTGPLYLPGQKQPAHERHDNGPF
jgi:predicted small lipoprotein YifL